MDIGRGRVPGRFGQRDNHCYSCGLPGHIAKNCKASPAEINAYKMRRAQMRLVEQQEHIRILQQQAEGFAKDATTTQFGDQGFGSPE